MRNMAGKEVFIHVIAEVDGRGRERNRILNQLYGSDRDQRL
jgi:hypothetical protein